MKRRTGHGSFWVVLALALALGPGARAQAHCCHDDREVLVSRQNSLGRDSQGRLDAREERELGAGSSPSARRRAGGSLRRSGSGLGELRGNSLGNYGAGSPGERGPGGLGALGAPPPTQKPR